VTKSAKIITIVLLLSALIVLSSIMISPQSPDRLTVNGNSVSVLPAEIVWQKTFGGSTENRASDSRAFYSLPDSNGYLVVGSTTSINANETVAWAISLNEDGNEIWNKTFPIGFGSEFRYVLNLTDGFLLVGNEFLQSGGSNGFAIKIDNQGNTLWNTELVGNGKLFSGIAAQDSFVLFGSVGSISGNKFDVWVVKIDSNGKVIWNKSYESTADNAARTGALAPNGDIMAAGYANPEGSDDYHFLLMKIDPAGELLWNKTYAMTGSQEAHSMTKAPDGYVIVGDTQSLGTNIHAWVLKVDFSGNIQWNRTVGGTKADSPSYVTTTKDGGFLVAGFTFSWGMGNRDFWLFKINDAGQVLWSCTQGDAGYQEAYTAVQTSINQYVMVGWTDPLGQPTLVGKAKYDFYIVKLSPRQYGINLTEFQSIAYVLLVFIFLLATLLVVIDLMNKSSHSKIQASQQTVQELT
jgi:hypothetical protein